ncbi:MAG TPA: hypothetical protein PKI19_03785 [Elusimicrobiales bacterium]|nr:hypothetical protein [Elusimicrobiales bacterium]
MNDYNGKKEEKGGFWSALSGLFRGGASTMGGGASSGLGTAGGLFATKAGIVGMVLGGATIAAGVGVVYNFVGAGSKPVYSPELFQNSYYEEESAAASINREQSRDRSSASASTLDIFRDQAKKDGLGGLASEAGGDSKPADAAADAPANASADAPAADAPAAAAGAPDAGGAKLRATPGFGGSKGGGSSSSAMPRMQNGGGLSGGIGGQFASMYRAPAGQGNDGRTSAMGGSMAARVKGSPKYAVPNMNRRGAHAQAKFARNLGLNASRSDGASSMRTTAMEAFNGETTAGGDVAGGDAGLGMGGAGISNGSGLKANDPSINDNNSEVPVPEATTSKDVSPWKKAESDFFNAMLLGGAMLLALKGLEQLAKVAKGSMFMQYAVMVLALAALVTAIIYMVKAFKNAIKIFKGVGDAPYSKEGEYAGQSMMGGMYIAAGALLSVAILDSFMKCIGQCGQNMSDKYPKGSTVNGGGAKFTQGLGNATKGFGGFQIGDILGSITKGM